MEKIPDELYEKYKGQLRLQLVNVLGVFDCHGLGAYIQNVTDECVHLAEQFAMNVRGKEKPIRTKNNPHRRPTE